MKDWERKMIGDLLATTDCSAAAQAAIGTIMRMAPGGDLAAQLTPAEQMEFLIQLQYVRNWPLTRIRRAG